jgi:syntaxin-binding protein 1
MDAIKAIQPPGKWKIVVVDSKSIGILNASCKMYDILEENVSLASFCTCHSIEPNLLSYRSLVGIHHDNNNSHNNSPIHHFIWSSSFVVVVENIEKNRQPYPTLAAIYFLTPCRESILRLVDDFSAHKEPLYNAAHVYFTSGKSDLNKG